jgi:multiple sugar transport system permease protein
MSTTLDLPNATPSKNKSLFRRILYWFRTPRGRNTVAGYIFISPFILGVLLWVVIPAGIAAWLVFQDWNMIKPAEFVGLANIKRMFFQDPLFWKSLKITTIYTFTSVPLGLIISFFMALLINTKVKGLAFFRTVYYLPSIMPAVASAVLWAWILNTDFGLLNAVINSLGFPKIAWLQETEWALLGLTGLDLDESVECGCRDDHLFGGFAGHR